MWNMLVLDSNVAVENLEGYPTHRGPPSGATGASLYQVPQPRTPVPGRGFSIICLWKSMGTCLSEMECSWILGLSFRRVHLWTYLLKNFLTLISSAVAAVWKVPGIYRKELNVLAFRMLVEGSSLRLNCQTLSSPSQ